MRATWVKLVGDVQRFVTRPQVVLSLGLLSATGVNAVFGFVFWLVTARRLDVASVGLAASLVPAFSLAAVLAAAGLVPSLHVWVARWQVSKRRLAVTVAIAAVAAAALTTVVVWLSGPVLRTSLEAPWLAAAVFTGGAATASTVLVDAVLVARRRPGALLVRSITAAVGKLLVLALWPSPVSVTSVLVAWSLALVVSLLVVAPRVFGKLSATGSPDRSSRVWAVNHVSQVAAQAPAFVLPLLVAARAGVAANAEFYAAWLFATAFFMVPPAVATTLLTEGSRDPVRLRQHVHVAIRLSVLLLLPAVAVMLLFSGWLLSWFGPQYEPAASTLRVLALSAPAVCATALLVAVLRATDRVSFAGWVTTSAAVLTVSLSWWAASAGPLAVAWAWTLAQYLTVLAAGLWLWVTRRPDRGAPVEQPVRFTVQGA